MTRHREGPVCASCHEVMDPFGFALENFDAVGRWRDLDSGLPIDAAAEFFDGSTRGGVTGLRELLLHKQDLFAATATEKLMTYALGRSLTPADKPAVREIMRTAAGTNYSFSSIVLGLVTSTPFQMRTAAAQPAAELSAGAQ